MEREAHIRHVTLAGGAVNVLLVLFKFAAGIMGNSAAMLADAGHSLSDFASDLIILLCIRVSGKPEDEDHPYGHGKFETLAAAVTGLILIMTGIGFFWDGFSAIIEIIKGERIKPPAWIAFWAAIISILAKEGLYHYTMAAAKKTDSQTLKANAWHHRSDALSSIATVLGIGGAILGGEKWVILDPLAACVISFLIFGMAISIMKPAIEDLMEKSLPASETARIGAIIASTPEVKGYHHLRTRRLGFNRAVEAHIKLDGTLTLQEAHEIATNVENRIRAAVGRHTHTGIHMEPDKTGAEVNRKKEE